MNSLMLRAFADELIKIAAPEREPFWDRVDKSGKDGCWEWTGAKNSDGYAVVREGKSIELASRVAYRKTHGKEPADGVVSHTCDNRSCVNPAHLRSRTQGENLQDMHDKGRHPHN